MARILLADNKLDELGKWAGVVRREGYEVIEAASVAAADAYLKKGGLDLAILDLHMETDGDENDDSGLQLAHKYRGQVPIILLTALPTLKAALEALRRDGRSSPADAFILKLQDGPKVLLKAIQDNIVPKVFLCHGRDLETTASVKKFLEDGGVQVVVLRDKPGAGQTIIEKFEKNSNVDFAIILVTPDDEGGLKGKEHRPRARQNVIFELGFFLAQLERSRVVTLYKDDGVRIELPSNYDGVHKIDMGDLTRPWRNELAKEMHAAKIKLDLARALLEG